MRSTALSLFASLLCATSPFMTIAGLSGCTEAGIVARTFGSEDTSSGTGNMGGGTAALAVPFAPGVGHLCVQGVGGSYSHTGTSTYYDIDLDTSNSEDEEIFAPVSGIAHVHMDSASTGFGYHVNIELSDGTYVVIGHFSEIFIQDQEEVAIGQLIGFDGCTGACTGDHVHIGLHEGDASQPAEYGVSVVATYFALDTSMGNGEDVYASSELVCGLASAGDPSDGHYYASDLSINLWHPDGTLIMSPESSKVYLIEDQKLRWVEDQDVFWSHGYDFDDVALVSAHELSCFGHGATLSEQGFVDALYDDDGTLWFLHGPESDLNRFRAQVHDTSWDAVLASWGLHYSLSNPPASESSSAYDLDDWPRVFEPLRFRDGSLVREQSTSDVYVMSGGVAVPILDWQTYLLQGYFPREVLYADDGAIELIMEAVGSCRADQMCLDQEAITTCGGGLDLGDYGDYGGIVEDEDDTPEDTDEPEEEEDEEEDEEEEIEDDEEEEEEDPVYDDEDTDTPPDTGYEWDDSDPCEGEAACVQDIDGDGVNETLLMIDDAWLSSSIYSEDAYVYASRGTCFDGTLSSSDRFATDPSTGYYFIDFSSFANVCTSELTLVSSVGTDGTSPDSTMGNWYWWQNASFCAAGSALCELQSNGTSWEEWLISVSWDPTSGLLEAGNGYTSNDQL